MHGRSSLSEEQREAAVAWLEKGNAYRAAARLLSASRQPGHSIGVKDSWSRSAGGQADETGVLVRVQTGIGLTFLAGRTVTDLTEFSVGDRTLYLSPVMDLFDKQIISYTVGRCPARPTATTTPGNFFRHLKEELFHHVRFISTEGLAAQLREYIHWYSIHRNLKQSSRA